MLDRDNVWSGVVWALLEFGKSLDGIVWMILSSDPLFMHISTLLHSSPSFQLDKEGSNKP